MSLKDRLENVILFNGKPLSAVKNGRARRAMLNMIDNLATDTVVMQSLFTSPDAVCNAITAAPDSYKEFAFVSENLNDDIKQRVEKVYADQLTKVFTEQSNQSQ